MGFGPVSRQRFALWVTVFALCGLSSPSWGEQTPISLNCEHELVGSEYLQTLKENIFIVSRDFRDYFKAFGPEFLELVDAMRGREKWVDFGSGEARAQLDVLRARAAGSLLQSLRYRQNRLISLALNYPENVPAEYRNLRKQFEASEKFAFLGGRRLEEISDSEIGHFDIGTDYFGPLTYSLDLSLVLNKYLRLMREPQYSRLFMVFSETADKATFIETLDGRRLPLSQWLKSQEGLKLTSLSKGEGGIASAFSLQKLSADAQVPELELVDIRKNGRGLIVWRVFREKAVTSGD